MILLVIPECNRIKDMRLARCPGESLPVIPECTRIKDMRLARCPGESLQRH